MSDSLQVGIVGAGLIGTKRAEAIVATGEGKLRAVADIDENRAETLARKYGAEAVANWEDLILRKDLGAIVVAVPNVFATSIVLAALKSGKHIFCEKPLGVNAKESLKIVNAGKKAKKLVKVGFNHRFHAALLEAHKIFESGSIGAILFIRARYGHGGRIGMEKEWRFDRRTPRSGSPSHRFGALVRGGFRSGLRGYSHKILAHQSR
jgi:predicted dehydrogenase